MKRKLFIIVCLIIATAIVSCRKEQNLQNTGSAVAIQGLAKSTVNKWISRYNGSIHWNNANHVVSLLDYSNSIEIIRPGRSNLLLIQMKENDQTGRNQYLALAEGDKKNSNSIYCEGIYVGKNLDLIQQAISTNKLPIGERVTVTNINKQPISEWEATIENKMLIKIAKPKIKGVDKSNENIKTRSIRLNERSLGDPNCIDWYWIVYNFETGEILYAEYLYTTCADDGSGGGGGGDGANNDDICENPLAGASAYNVNRELLMEEPDENGGRDKHPRDFEEPNDGSSSTAPLTKNVAVPWAAVEGSTWTVNSTENASLKYSYSDKGWTFTNFSHSSLSWTGTVAGGTLTVSLREATPRVWTLAAGMSLIINVKSEVICKGSPIANAKDYSSSILLDVRNSKYF